VAPVFSLTQEQSAEFDRAGMLRVPNFFPQHAMSEMADEIWTDLHKRFGIERQRSDTWTKERPAQFQKLIRSGAFDSLGDSLAAIADAVLGSGAWDRPRHVGQPLVTFPSGTWDVPHAMWHLDLPATASLGTLPIVRVFALLEPVRPRGGGTCYVEASHRVVADLACAVGETLRSADVKALLLAEEPWFAALFSQASENRKQRFMIDGGLARGIEVRVREIVGEAGDAYVMHPSLLHTIAPNALDRPRLMLVQPLVRRGWNQDRI
jgi:phytanoyl-CoA dioxygenase PhyH